MTRRVSAGRYGEAGPWIVNLGKPSAFDSSEETLADRYSATARLRHGAVTALTVTDRVSRATFGWTERGRRVTVRMADDETAENLARLWRDGRNILGLARRQTGGPISGTGPSVEDLVQAAIVLKADSADWPIERTLAESEYVNLSIRQVRRIAKNASGVGDPYARIIALASERVRREP